MSQSYLYQLVYVTLDVSRGPSGFQAAAIELVIGPRSYCLTVLILRYLWFIRFVTES
jgi:hypothetical protein